MLFFRCVALFCLTFSLAFASTSSRADTTFIHDSCGDDYMSMLAQFYFMTDEPVKLFSSWEKHRDK